MCDLFLGWVKLSLSNYIYIFFRITTYILTVVLLPSRCLLQALHPSSGHVCSPLSVTLPCMVGRVAPKAVLTLNCPPDVEVLNPAQEWVLERGVSHHHCITPQLHAYYKSALSAGAVPVALLSLAAAGEIAVMVTALFLTPAITVVFLAPAATAGCSCATNSRVVASLLGCSLPINMQMMRTLHPL